MASQNINRPENVFTMIEDWMLNKTGTPSEAKQTAAYIERLLREQEAEKARRAPPTTTDTPTSLFGGGDEPAHWTTRRQGLSDFFDRSARSAVEGGQGLSDFFDRRGRSAVEGRDKALASQDFLNWAERKADQARLIGATPEVRGGVVAGKAIGRSLDPRPSPEETEVLDLLKSYIGISPEKSAKREAIYNSILDLPSETKDLILDGLENISDSAQRGKRNLQGNLVSTLESGKATLESGKAIAEDLIDKLAALPIPKEIINMIENAPERASEAVESLKRGRDSAAEKLSSTIDFIAEEVPGAAGAARATYDRMNMSPEERMAANRKLMEQRRALNTQAVETGQFPRSGSDAAATLNQLSGKMPGQDIQNWIGNYLKNKAYPALTEEGARARADGAGSAVVAENQARNAESLNKSINLRQSVTDGLRAGMTVGNLRDEKQYRGVMDAVIGEQMSDKVRKKIRWDSPVWQSPSTGFIGLLQNMMTNPMASAPGVSGWGQIGYAGDAQRTRAAAGALAASEARSKAMTAEAALRTAQKPPKLPEHADEHLTRYARQGDILDVLQDFKDLLSDTRIGGGVAGSRDFLHKASRITGLDIGSTGKERAQAYVQHLAFAWKELYGAQVNKQEFARIDQFIKDYKGWGEQVFSADTDTLNRINLLMQKVVKERRSGAAILTAQGFEPNLRMLQQSESWGEGDTQTGAGRASQAGDLISGRSDG